MRRHTLGLVLCCLVFVSALSAQPTKNSSLKILFPKPESVVNNGTLIQAAIEPPSARQMFSNVSFSYSKDGTHFLPITGSAPDGLSEYGVLWNAQSLAGGRYVIRVEAVPKNRETTRPLTQTIHLFVNEQPHAVADLTLVSEEPLRVRFDGSGSTDPDGHVLSYHWNFEDGATADGKTAEHNYPAPGRYTFQLTVTDNLGGKGTTDHIFTISRDSKTGRAQF